MALAGRLVLLLAALALGCSAAGARSTEIAVRVGYVAVDPSSDTPVLVLEELDGDRLLPIWIGFAEARSIAAQLNDVEPPRPGTHDLAKRVIDRLAGRVDHVVVTELAGGIYYATLSIRTASGLVEIDSRPSDAIAIALRYDAPLFVREALFETSQDASGVPEAGQGI